MKLHIARRTIVNIRTEDSRPVTDTIKPLTEHERMRRDQERRETAIVFGRKTFYEIVGET